MHHLRFWALYSRRVRERTRLSPLYRVSSLAPQPDPDVPQARCSLRVPQRLMVRPAFTLTPLILGIHFIPSAPRCSRYARGYRCCEPWAHSSLCRHSALPCLRFTARRHRQSKKIQPRSEFKARFFRIKAEVGQSVMPKPILRVGSSSHIGDFTAHSLHIILHIPLI